MYQQHGSDHGLQGGRQRVVQTRHGPIHEPRLLFFCFRLVRLDALSHLAALPIHLNLLLVVQRARHFQEPSFQAEQFLEMQF